MIIRTYSELIKIPTFEERYRYLKLNGRVGEETFGFDRWLNQVFYKDKQWRQLRNHIIVRDNGCDLGVPDRKIGGVIYVHHMNPISIEDIINQTDFLLNPDYLICSAKPTHDAIHYGDENLLMQDYKERRPGDTRLW